MEKPNESITVTCKTWIDGNEIVKRIKASVSADHLCLSNMGIAAGTEEDPLCIFSDLPRLFLETYINGGLFQDDPLVLLTANSDVVVDDGLAFSLKKPSQQLVDLFRENRIQSRTFIPIFSNEKKIALLSVCRRDNFTRSEIDFLTWVARPLLDNLRMEYKPKCFKGSSVLTHGETVCLQLANKGLSSEEIAEQSSYSKLTINSYLKDAARKLGAQNRTQAVVIALKNGLIE